MYQGNTGSAAATAATLTIILSKEIIISSQQILSHIKFLFPHLKENSQAQIAEKYYKHPLRNESVLAMHMALDLQYSASLIL
jgi:hypothetical protein